MPPCFERSQLKRAVTTPPADEPDSSKKPRRSACPSQNQSAEIPVDTQPPWLPSPASADDSSLLFADGLSTEGIVAPVDGPSSQLVPRSQEDSYAHVTPVSSSLAPEETQPFTQPPEIDVNKIYSKAVTDEVNEGVWGYLLPCNPRYGGQCVVLRNKALCSKPHTVAEALRRCRDDSKAKASAVPKQQEKRFETLFGSYLIGRHRECDIVVDDQSRVSNRHCVIFTENKAGDTVVMVEDLSMNGTFVNQALVGRNRCRELTEGDEIAVVDKICFVLRYPQCRQSSSFLQQYTLLEELGHGQFAQVHLCVEKATGQRYAVKIIRKTPGLEGGLEMQHLQHEIAILMSVNHPNVLCLRDNFIERDSVFIVLELAPEGELFNAVVAKQKLSEEETRHVFTQLLPAVKYLHDRNIVHRDIKLENVLMMDTNLHVKLADFGLATIVGEESFTTTICGTPHYVAPEILADSEDRMYTKAVDIWSLGVVLYACLCGFHPFSDELYSEHFPYLLSEQIKLGLFEYPTPYWDSIGESALDLIDNMLVVDPQRRFTVDQCLAHPWMTASLGATEDKWYGLASGVQGLAINRRDVARERTLLSSIYNCLETRQVADGNGKDPITAHRRNPRLRIAEPRPCDGRKAEEFMAIGGKGDVELFEKDAGLFANQPSIAHCSKHDSAPI